MLRIGRVGRADCMGLAVSFVATEPERVWYCSKKVSAPLRARARALSRARIGVL